MVEGLIPQGLSVFCGQSKIGKSWLILYPECISFKTRRTGSRRLIELRRRDANDDNDGSDGMEMLPFYNIFNEWYAAQTSKKIRAVWQSKAEHGKRVSPAVPFGYMKGPKDKEQG